MQQSRAKLVPTAEDTAKHLLDALQAYANLQQQMDQARAKEKLQITKQIKAQFQQIIYPNFIVDMPFTSIKHLPRYLQAATIRLEHGPRRFAKDQEAEASCQQLWDKYQNYLKQYPEAAQKSSIQSFRWSLEELRVSLFAANLKTAETVPIKRLQQRWQEVICAL